jgi:hypothetical protein
MINGPGSAEPTVMNVYEWENGARGGIEPPTLRFSGRYIFPRTQALRNLKSLTAELKSRLRTDMVAGCAAKPLSQRGHFIEMARSFLDGQKIRANASQ